MPIITYIDDRSSSRRWRMDAPIYAVPSIDDYLSIGEPGDILIVHGNQPDAHLLAADGRPRLVSAVVRVCHAGGRAVIFSGGHPQIFRTLRDDLARESLEEDRHYLLLTAVHNLEDEIDIERMKEEPIGDDWPISEVRRHYAAPTLLTLGVLCQGALFSFDPTALDDETVLFFGGRETMDAIITSSSIPLAERVRMQTPTPWQAALGRNHAKVLTALEREWPAGAPSHTSLNHLLDAVYDGGTALQPDVLSAAFAELNDALLRNEGMQH